MHTSIAIAVVALGLTCVAAQRVSGGGCPEVPVKADLDIPKYMGLWYEIEKIPAPFQIGLKCITATYEYQGDYVTVVNEGVGVLTGAKRTIYGNATIPDPEVPAKLEVKFGILKGKYTVLDTDYENYALVYSCSSYLKIFKMEFLWVLSRQPTLDDAHKETVYKLLENNGISKKGLVRTTQDCN